MPLKQRRFGSIESLEQRQLMAGDTFGALTPVVEPAAMVFVRIPNIGDDSVIVSHNASATNSANSFTFGVEREMKESGEKGGTTDINIGVGELQECSISKSRDSSSVQLAEAHDRALADVAATQFRIDIGHA